MPIINGQGRVAVRVTGGAPAPSSSYLLDTYGGAAAAYSLRKLSSTYSGSAIRVRRSSDNTEQNIGFDGSGNLDTTALTSFVGGGNGFVTTWFDQSGGGRNAVQSSAVNQPQIVTSGVINTLSSKPSVRFNGTSSKMTFTEILGVTGLEIFNLTDYSTISGGGFNWDLNSPILSYTGGFIQDFVIGTRNSKISIYVENNGNELLQTTATINTNTPYIVNGYGSSTSIGVGFNNSNYVTSIGKRNDLSVRSLGQDAGSLWFQGNLTEVIVYSSIQSANRSGINTNINTYYSIYPSDADAAAFVSAAGITDSTQASAVNTLVTSLKSAGIWTKMKAIYPFVGGTASSHKFNLKDPRDLDAAYRLVFNGGWTHSSTGALPNGTTGYADTKLNPSTALSSFNSNHISFYSRTQNLVDSANMGGGAAGSYITIELGSQWNGTTWINASLNPTTGLLTNTRLANNIQKFFRNGNQLGSTNTTSSTSSANANIYIGARNIGGGNQYAARESAFASIGDGLTDADVTALYTAVQAFQTTLGRQV